MNSLDPTAGSSSEMGNIITKVILISKTAALKGLKTWEDMAAKGGISLALTQLRALAHKSAQKALEKAGQKGLENSIFREMFEQIGKKLTKKTIERSMPYIGLLIGAFFDTAQMNTVIEYADIFYHKRFLLEKENRIEELLNSEAMELIDLT